MHDRVATPFVGYIEPGVRRPPRAGTGEGRRMKILFRVSVLFFGITIPATSPSFAQSGWFWQNPLPQGNHLEAAATLDPSTVVAVGAGGTILRTTNGGATWTPQSSGTTHWLFGVSFVDANTGTAVGAAGTILLTTDGGATWTPQSSGTTNPLLGVAFVDANTGAGVGDFGTILRTTDGGATWTPQSSGTTNPLLGVAFVDANTGAAVGYFGTILRTTDGGATWTPQSSGTTSWLNGVSFVDANTGTAVGDFGTILRTTDGGRHLDAPIERDDQFAQWSLLRGRQHRDRGGRGRGWNNSAHDGR